MVAQELTLSERAQHLLKVLIDRYTRDGQPVGSRTLARETGLDLSPATIRNVMADLEELGLVHAPHTSAGRVPTIKGYRFFVDTLLSVRPLTSAEVERLRKQLDTDQRTEVLMETASDLLSGVTSMAGLVTLPRIEHGAWRRLEFLPLSGNRVLSIMVVNEREVQNRIIHTARRYSQSELEQAANYLNEAFTGKSIFEVRDRILEEMRDARDSMNRLMASALDMAEKVFESTSVQDDYVLAGQTNLMAFAELSNVEKLRHLFEAFNHKRDILHILDQCLHAQGVQIFIGEESGFKALDDCSVVTSSYEVDGQVVGVLGVIGPTRMAYERVIPIVDTTARLLSAALNQDR